MQGSVKIDLRSAYNGLQFEVWMSYMNWTAVESLSIDRDSFIITNELLPENIVLNLSWDPRTTKHCFEK